VVARRTQTGVAGVACNIVVSCLVYAHAGDTFTTACRQNSLGSLTMTSLGFSIVGVTPESIV